MSGQNFREFTYTLAANGELTIERVGQYVSILSATGAFEIAIGDEPFSPFRAGLTALLPTRFHSVRLRDTSAATNTISLVIGQGDLRDARFTVSGALTIGNITGAALADAADVSCVTVATTQLVAAAAGRRAVIVTNPAANPREVRVGTSSAGAARGAELAPGGTLRLDTADAVHAFNPHSAAQSITVTTIG